MGVLKHAGSRIGKYTLTCMHYRPKAVRGKENSYASLMHKPYILSCDTKVLWFSSNNLFIIKVILYIVN